jgi:Transposase, Mutator family
MVEWQNRPLDPVYLVVFIDALVVKIREGQVANWPIYQGVVGGVIADPFAGLGAEESVSAGRRTEHTSPLGRVVIERRRGAGMQWDKSCQTAFAARTVITPAPRSTSATDRASASLIRIPMQARSPNRVT